MAKILTVDDAAFMRKVIKDTLTKAGYTEIFEAEDGAMAVEKYNELKPDLVLMDIIQLHMIWQKSLHMHLKMTLLGKSFQQKTQKLLMGKEKIVIFETKTNFFSHWKVVLA